MSSCQGCGIELDKVRHSSPRRCAGFSLGCCEELALCEICENREPGRKARYEKHVATCHYRLAKLKENRDDSDRGG